MSERARRGRGKTIVSVIFLLVIFSKHSEQQPGEEGDPNGIVSTLRVIPEVAGELAQAISAMLNSGSQ